MTVNFSYTISNQVTVQTVTLGDDSEYANYLVSVHGELHAEDEESGGTTSRSAIFYSNDPSTIASAEDLVAFVALTEVPQSIIDSAEALIADEEVRLQMVNDIVAGSRLPVMSVAPWAD
tara:strand:- start:441 stop:797 length:357 start_codon:yes stop_codon:yes gene_type:complete